MKSKTFASFKIRTAEMQVEHSGKNPWNSLPVTKKNLPEWKHKLFLKTKGYLPSIPLLFFFFLYFFSPEDNRSGFGISLPIRVEWNYFCCFLPKWNEVRQHESCSIAVEPSTVLCHGFFSVLFAARTLSSLFDVTEMRGAHLKCLTWLPQGTAIVWSWQVIAWGLSCDIFLFGSSFLYFLAVL